MADPRLFPAVPAPLILNLVAHGLTDARRAALVAHLRRPLPKLTTGWVSRTTSGSATAGRNAALLFSVAAQAGTEIDEPHDDGLWATALWEPPFAALIDAGGADDAAVAAWVAEAAGFALYANVATATAHRLGLAQRITNALSVLWPHAAKRVAALELAVHEAVVNAIIHGNLDLAGIHESGIGALASFTRTLNERLADSERAARRLTVTVTAVGPDGARPQAVDIAVHDEGAGFAAPAAPCAERAAGGRGLRLIAALARTTERDDGGRCLRMRFDL